MLIYILIIGYNIINKNENSIHKIKTIIQKIINKYTTFTDKLMKTRL